MGIKERAREHRRKMNIQSQSVVAEEPTKVYTKCLLALVSIFLCALLVQGTFAWIHMTQHVNGAVLFIHKTYPVELHKYQRQTDATYTEIPMEDVGFALYKENGEQVETIFWTDEEGKIYTKLPVGNYYWKEIYYTTGWGPDIDQEGNTILTYPFEVTEHITEEEPLVVVAYNLPQLADLEVEKIVQNQDGSQLSEAQLEQAFEFTITFSDEESYKYYISHNDEDPSEEPQWLEITSGDSIYLTHGQVAVIQDLPVGTTYTVRETPVLNYTTTSAGHLGTIIYGENQVVFTNTYDPVYGSILVTKEVVNSDGSDLTQEQREKEFLFTAWVDGEEISFVLKHGEEYRIMDLPIGTKYRVEEFDYVEDKYYASVLVYEGEILGTYEHHLPFINIYDPVDELGDLIVRKILVAHEEDLELDYDLEFTFEITFSYKDGTEEIIEFTLKGDELGDPSLWKIFEDIPVGTKYSIREIGTAGYLPESDVVEGYITGKKYIQQELDTQPEIEAQDLDAFAVVEDKYSMEEVMQIEEPEQLDPEDMLSTYQVVTFYNHPETYKIIEITKEVVGEVPEIDSDKEFLIRLFIDGELLEEFTLTAGEMKSFEVPQYARYEVWEEDYQGEGYAQLIMNGYGTIIKDVTEVTVINKYLWEEEEVQGEKTWSDSEEAQDYIPESIIVRLMLGDTVIEEQVVQADKDGKWIYTFTAPKYDHEGQEIEYRVVEVPIDCFYPTYEGYDIHNNFVNSIAVLLPVLEKQVIGLDAPEEKFGFELKGYDNAPMPAGADGDEFVYIQYGAGEQAMGEIRYVKPGLYQYTIRELIGHAEGWIYDTTVYKLEVLVEEGDSGLRATYTIYREDETADRAVFVNKYDPKETQDPEDTEDPEDLEAPEDPEVPKDDTSSTIVSGKKTWIHGENPLEEQPRSLVIYLLANGELIRTIEINNESNWSYSFTVPRYDKAGVQIEYTIEEELVPNYVASGEGYDLINTYDQEAASSYAAGTKTADYTNIFIWIIAMIMSFGIWVAVVYGRENR